MAIIGYARVSTDLQRNEGQVDVLKAAGCTTVYEEAVSAHKTRPVLAKVLRTIQKGDVLLIVRLDRLARSLPHLLDTIEKIEKRGAHLRSLNDPVDTSTPQGLFAVQIMGAVAELERGLIVERTKAGLAAARRRGRVGGNPKIGDQDYMKQHRAKRQEDYIEAASPDDLLPIIQRMRPQQPWREVAVAINAEFPNSEPWNMERTFRLAQHLAKRGRLDPALLKRAPKTQQINAAMPLVVSMFKLNPGITLKEVVRRLEGVGQPTTRGGRWYPSTVAYVRDLAIKKGYLSPKSVAIS